MRERRGQRIENSDGRSTGHGFDQRGIEHSDGARENGDRFSRDGGACRGGSYHHFRCARGENGGT